MHYESKQEKCTRLTSDSASSMSIATFSDKNLKHLQVPNAKHDNPIARKNPKTSTSAVCVPLSYIDHRKGTGPTPFELISHMDRT
jgi:hypothetical protein